MGGALGGGAHGQAAGLVLLVLCDHVHGVAFFSQRPQHKQHGKHSRVPVFGVVVGVMLTCCHDQSCYAIVTGQCRYCLLACC